MSQLLSKQFQVAIEVHCRDNPSCTCELYRLSQDILPILRDAERSKRAAIQPEAVLDYLETPRCSHCGENQRFCDEAKAKFGAEAGKCCPICEHNVAPDQQPAVCPECDGTKTRVLWDETIGQYGPTPCPDCTTDQQPAPQPEAAHPDTARLDYLLNWLGFNEDVSAMPVRDWTDNADARAAIDEARTADQQSLVQEKT